MFGRHNLPYVACLPNLNINVNTMRSHKIKSSLRTVSVALLTLTGVCTAAQANIPKCGALSARFAQMYALAVHGKFDLHEPVAEMESLIATSVGMTKDEFKRTFPGGYYEWFALEALRAYEAHKTDALELFQSTTARCLLEFPKSPR